MLYLTDDLKGWAQVGDDVLFIVKMQYDYANNKVTMWDKHGTALDLPHGATSNVFSFSLSKMPFGHTFIAKREGALWDAIYDITLHEKTDSTFWQNDETDLFVVWL
jgi:hypothetical protein